MKKFLILIIVILLTGCTSNVQSINDDFDIRYKVDEETCVEYILINGSYKGSIIPRLNRDGTLKLNEKCLIKEVKSE